MHCVLHITSVFPYLCVTCVSVELEHITEKQEVVTGGADKSPKEECRSSTTEAVRDVSVLNIYH